MRTRTDRQITPTLPEEPSGATRILENLKDFITRPPQNETEDDFEDVTSSINNPIETNTEEVMAIISPRKTPIDKEPQPEATSLAPSTETSKNKKPLTRVKIFTAAVPSELEKRVNEYLTKTETDPRLSNLELVSTCFSSSGQGYSVMLTYKLDT